MDGEAITRTVSIIAGASSLTFGAVSGGLALFAKAKELRRIQAEKRQQEILRLRAAFEKNQNAFAEVFDYATPLDAHLRTTNLHFTPEEVETRSRVDKAFEHLRDVDNSVRLGLIKKIDLDSWIYWIYRTRIRKPIFAYAKACGYLLFLNRLADWTAKSRELKELKKECPWWTTIEND